MIKKKLTAVESNQKLAELQKLQSQGKEPKMPANIDPSVIIPEHDAGYIHVRLTTRVHNDKFGTYEEFHEIKSFAPGFYVNNENYITLGYEKVEIVHDPRLMK
jgi:hypothetical protein